jgi:hypothetical protein
LKKSARQRQKRNSRSGVSEERRQSKQIQRRSSEAPLQQSRSKKTGAAFFFDLNACQLQTKSNFGMALIFQPEYLQGNLD